MRVDKNVHVSAVNHTLEVMPKTFPVVISWLKGNSSGNSLVVAITRLSMLRLYPGRLFGSTPLNPCRDGMYWSLVSWPSAGSTNFSC